MDPVPSIQSRLLSAAVRTIVRRANWGEEAALTRRARLLFGSPRPYAALASLWILRERFTSGSVRGEWNIPKAYEPGVILYVHGGGFVACSASTHAPIAAALAYYSRRRVFSVDYRLAPEHRFPAAIEDVRAAYEYLCATLPNTHPIAIAGDSAGGNLAIGLAARCAADGLPIPSRVVGFSPWLDLAATGASVRTNNGLDPIFRPRNLEDFAAAYLGGISGRHPDASPLYGPVDTMPPLLLHVGSTELLLDDTRRFHERVRGCGRRSELVVFDQAPHCWQMVVPWLPEARQSLRAAAAFISASGTGS
jgi:epsilon-lactone hydrolase